MGRKLGQKKKTPKIFREACGDEIQRLRKKHKLTQKELGERLIEPVDLTTIHRWESGNNTVSMFHYFAVCYALGETPIFAPQWEAFKEAANAKDS